MPRKNKYATKEEWRKAASRRMSGINNTFYGKHHSEETKKKLSNFRLGTPNMKLRGRVRTLEHRKNLSKALKGKWCWCKGKKLPDISALKKGVKRSPETVKRMSLGMMGKYRGVKNGNWRGGITRLTLAIRNCTKMDEWRVAVYKRDGNKCVMCNAKGLHAHHIEPLAILIKKFGIKTIDQAMKCEELWKIENGQTMCLSCHQKTDSYASTFIKNRDILQQNFR